MWIPLTFFYEGLYLLNVTMEDISSNILKWEQEEKIVLKSILLSNVDSVNNPDFYKRVLVEIETAFQNIDEFIIYESYLLKNIAHKQMEIKYIYVK
jgi:hypothetical protein